MIKEMAPSVESLTKNLEEMKINDHCFFGKDLSYEQNFLEKIKKKLSKIFRILKFLILSEKGWWLYVLRKNDERKNCKRSSVQSWLVDGWTL